MHRSPSESRLPAQKPPRDEVLLATRRYNAMVERGVTSRLAWRSIATRLYAASHRLEGDRCQFVRDRATDAHHRADTLPPGRPLLRRFS